MFSSEYQPLLDQSPKDSTKRNLKWISIISGIVFLILLVLFSGNYYPLWPRSALSSESSDTLRVGFIEHVVQFDPTASTVDECRAVIYGNLDTLETYVIEASEAGVELLQFPEFGLIGLINYYPQVTNSSTPTATARALILKYIEQVPDPNLGTDSTPCENDDFSDRPILQRISCMAKDNSIYLSVNYGDYLESSASSDGILQYNTQIIFDSDGQIIQKYWKMHLFSEPEFDTPSEDDPKYFEMPYGDGSDTVRIGLMTCFDSMYPEPSASLMKQGINFFLISHWWVNTLTAPTSTAVQWFQSLSRQYQINFVVAASTWFYGIVTPVYSSGSGIFSAGEILAQYFNLYNSATSHFAYADVPIDIDGPYIDSSVTYAPNTIEIEVQDDGIPVDMLEFCRVDLGYATAGTTLSGTVSCGTSGFTCSITLEVSEDSTESSAEWWIIEAAEGYYNVSDGAGVYYYEQICSAYSCTNYNCGLFIINTLVDSVTVTAQFDAPSLPFVQMLTSGGVVYEDIMDTTSYSVTTAGAFSLESEGMDSANILDIAVLSRDFAKDGTAASSSTSSSSSSFNSRSRSELLKKRMEMRKKSPQA